MKKVTLLLIVFIALLFISCSKDEDVIIPIIEETPTGLIFNTGLGVTHIKFQLKKGTQNPIGYGTIPNNPLKIEPGAYLIYQLLVFNGKDTVDVEKYNSDLKKYMSNTSVIKINENELLSIKLK